jgi:hypothetical protein
MGWVTLASLLMGSASLIGMIAQQRSLNLHHTVLGGALFLAPVAALACSSLAALSWWRGKRNAGR